MTNPMELMQMVRGSANPMQTLMSMSRRNPQLQQVMQMVNGKTPDQMRNIAYDVARQKGVDLPALAQQMGIKLP